MLPVDARHESILKHEPLFRGSAAETDHRDVVRCGRGIGRVSTEFNFLVVLTFIIRIFRPQKADGWPNKPHTMPGAGMALLAVLAVC